MKNETILELQQYRCRQCGRVFYIHAGDRSDLDLDYGCVFGCDDNGRRMQDLTVTIQQVRNIASLREAGD